MTTELIGRLRQSLAGIRPRIVIWYVGLFTALLVVALLSIRQILLVQFDKDVETALAQEAEELRLAVEQSEPGLSIRELFSTFLAQNFPGEQEVFVAIVGERLYGAVPNSRAGPVAGDELIDQWAAIGEPRFGESATEDGPRRWLAVPIQRNGVDRGTFVVTYDVQDELAAIDDAVVVMAAVSAGVLLLASILAWATAGRVLAPLAQLTRTARQISDDNLSERIPVDGEDEVAELTTTLNDMFDRLEGAFDQQRAFLNDAGHELRTPITIVRGHLELLPEDPGERSEVITVCLDELDRMGRHVSDLLTLAKAERPDFLTLRRVDLAAFTDGLEALARGLRADRRWVIEQLAPVEITADPDRLTQAMVNLLANAAQHTPTGSTIGFGSTLAQGEVRLWVTDTGAGIDPADHERIFDRFARGRESTTQRGEGSGLGLAIVEVVAQAHGGRVELESELGRGSTFTLVLPAADASQTGLGVEAVPPPVGADTLTAPVPTAASVDDPTEQNPGPNFDDPTQEVHR